MSKFIISEHEQQSGGWYKDRAGRATGSRARDIFATVKSGEAAARRDYRIELVTERLTGQAVPQGFVSKEMEHGTLNEPFARMEWENRHGHLVKECGFAFHTEIMAGCSVDGLLDINGKRGIFEAKCPKSATHLKYIMEGRMPPEYLPQIYHNMWIMEAEFAEFCSYDPRLPEHLQLFCVHIDRDDKLIFQHERDIIAFLNEVDELEATLRNYKVAA